VRKFIVHSNHITNSHILTLFTRGRDGFVTIGIVTETGATLIIVQGLAVSLKSVALAFEHITIGLIQRDAQLICDGNKRIGFSPNQPSAP
jgi:hypothetical protein